MSLILDALRKSEAERQRGKSPDLFAATPGAQRETFARMKLWPVLVFLGFLLASAWVIWRGEARRAHGEKAAIATTPAVGAGIETLDAPPLADKQAGRAARPDQGPASTAPGARTPIANEAARPLAIQSPASPPVVAAEPAPTTMAPATPPISIPPASAISPDTVPDAPAAESLPTVAILDSGTRASLPPLKLSMHVFGQDPTKRFAIIDGKRVGAGSMLGDGVVEEIRRDGVVIRVNGQRLLVPKP